MIFIKKKIRRRSQAPLHPRLGGGVNILPYTDCTCTTDPDTLRLLTVRFCAVLKRGQVGGNALERDALCLGPLLQQRQIMNTLSTRNDFLHECCMHVRDTGVGGGRG